MEFYCLLWYYIILHFIVGCHTDMYALFFSHNWMWDYMRI